MRLMGVLDKIMGMNLFPFKELWQDREVRFGCTKGELSLKEGETILESIDDVEDTKGHNGVIGKLLITNLRLMWWSKKSIGSGMSIGYGCFTRLIAKLSSSKSKGDTESLHISAKHHERDFYFVFTSLSNTALQVYSGVAHVLSVYDKTRLYRDVNLGGAFLVDGGLDRLGFEQTHSRVDGVWNLCGGEGNVGTFFVSNVRVVWCSCLRPCFNISIPFCQVANVNTKFGVSLVLESSKSSGAYEWNFKVEPEETLNFLYAQILSLWKAFNQEPFYGIDTQVQAEACTDALAAEPSGFSFTSQREDVRAMDAESRGEVVESYFAKSSFTSPPQSPTRPSPHSPARLSPHSPTWPSPHSPTRPSPNSFSHTRRSPSPSVRPSSTSFTRPSPTLQTRPSANLFARRSAGSSTSKGTDRELVYWCNLVALGLGPEEHIAEHL
ncbi:hypothetical protein DUNSADRAFT_17687 [Dunaliella salina]|uniref:BBSome complex member BBS5 PH domain-containing protein n=1 Tax=Dunaliella salina TaxID=3046 RepID=A0ABQ7G1A4_DUNSA|nr:hypothetical protein DUNSADRAFT_17687 [Dunaliella salina]|eukprot:KAF5828385.1 hypothetical protein DUNSADRAFT_17687 [Dunaliella salina]